MGLLRCLGENNKSEHSNLIFNKESIPNLVGKLEEFPNLDKEILNYTSSLKKNDSKIIFLEDCNQKYSPFKLGKENGEDYLLQRLIYIHFMTKVNSRMDVFDSFVKVLDKGFESPNKNEILTGSSLYPNFSINNFDISGESYVSDYMIPSRNSDTKGDCYCIETEKAPLRRDLHNEVQDECGKALSFASIPSLNTEDIYGIIYLDSSLSKRRQKKRINFYESVFSNRPIRVLNISE